MYQVIRVTHTHTGLLRAQWHHRPSQATRRRLAINLAGQKEKFGELLIIHTQMQRLQTADSSIKTGLKNIPLSRLGDLSNLNYHKGWLRHDPFQFILPEDSFSYLKLSKVQIHFKYLRIRKIECAKICVWFSVCMSPAVGNCLNTLKFPVKLLNFTIPK